MEIGVITTIAVNHHKLSFETLIDILARTILKNTLARFRLKWTETIDFFMV